MAASDTGASWRSGWLPPPPTLAETEAGPSRGPFSFWFQGGLAMPSDFQSVDCH